MINGFPNITVTYKKVGYMEPHFHTHSKYEIYYFHEGNSKYTVGGETFDLCPGDLIIMNGMTEHGPIVEKEELYIRSTLSIDYSELRTIENAFQSIDLLAPFKQLRNYRWSLRGELKEEIEHILMRIDRFQRGHGELSAYRFNNACLDLLLFIKERSNEVMTKKSPTSLDKGDVVQTVLAYIEEFYTKDISLEDLEKNLHFSRFYLMRAFKEITGQTIFEYVNERRIKQAMLLLSVDPEQLVSTICYQVGFKHPGHFSRNFKSLTGMTPEQYRKKQ